MSANQAQQNAAAAADSRSDVALVDVLPQHRFDERRCGAICEQQLDDFAGPAQLRQFQGGQSNPTYLIETPTKKFVLRKKPPGKLLPSAHLVEREYRILRALPGTDVPVPSARLLCEDAAIIGTSFYVMDHVEGRVITGVTLPQLTPAERAAIYTDYARIGAELHAVDFRACGLGDFGKPEGYVARQLDRWTKQYMASKTEENADMERLIAWLAAHLPANDETAIVHGDYRIGNTIIHPTEPRIIAVLDWELATLGHPLSDLAYACMYYHLPAGEGSGGLAGRRTCATLGIPDEQRIHRDVLPPRGPRPHRRLAVLPGVLLFPHGRDHAGRVRARAAGQCSRSARDHVWRASRRLSPPTGLKLADAQHVGRARARHEARPCPHNSNPSISSRAFRRETRAWLEANCPPKCASRSSRKATCAGAGGAAKFKSDAQRVWLRAHGGARLDRAGMAEGIRRRRTEQGRGARAARGDGAAEVPCCR